MMTPTNYSPEDSLAEDLASDDEELPRLKRHLLITAEDETSSSRSPSPWIRIKILHINFWYERPTIRYIILFIVYTFSDPQPGTFSCLLLKFIQFLVPVSSLAASLLSSCSAMIRRPKHNLSSYEIHAYVKQSFCSLHSAHVMNQRFNNIKSLEMLKPLEINQIGSHFSRT